MKDYQVIYSFQKKRHIEGLNFSGLLEIYDPDFMTPGGLKTACGALQLLFQGYEDDDRLPFTIPEMRQFHRALRRVWPHAPFFCDLETPFVAVEAASHFDHLQVLETSGELSFCLRPNEVRRYVKRAHDIIESLGSRAGMPAADIRERKQEFDSYIALHFGLKNLAKDTGSSNSDTACSI